MGLPPTGQIMNRWQICARCHWLPLRKPYRRRSQFGNRPEFLHGRRYRRRRRRNLLPVLSAIPVHIEPCPRLNRWIFRRRIQRADFPANVRRHAAQALGNVKFAHLLQVRWTPFIFLLFCSLLSVVDDGVFDNFDLCLDWRVRSGCDPNRKGCAPIWAFPR